MSPRYLQQALFMLVGGLFILAATLKVAEMRNPVSAKPGWMDAPGVRALVAAIEGSIGFWMISGFFKRAAWTVAVASLAVFATVSLAKTLNGEESCGCFGRVAVSPVAMLIFDFGLLAAVARWPPPRKVQFSESCETSPWGLGQFRMRRPMAAVLTLAVTIPAGLLLSRASRVAGIAAKGELVVLQPQEWLGQHFPLVPYINLGDLLLKGQWEVLLYHSNCPDCETALAGMARRSTIGATEEPRRAAVAVPPYGTTGNAVDDRGRIARGKLSEELDWFVETPLLVSLADGKVVSVRAGKSVLTGDVAQFNAEAIDNRATSGSDP